MANDLIPYWEPGDAITVHAEAAIVGKRFVAISGPRVDGNPQVSTCGAGLRAAGVAGRDAAIATKGSMIREGVVPVVAGAAITAGVEVEADALGEAIPLDAGISLGVAYDDAADGADCPIALNL